MLLMLAMKFLDSRAPFPYMIAEECGVAVEGVKPEDGDAGVPAADVGLTMGLLLAAGPQCVHTVQLGLTPLDLGPHCAAHVQLDHSACPMLQCVVCAVLDLSVDPMLQCAVSVRQASSPMPPILQHIANARQAPSAHPTAQIVSSVRWVTTTEWGRGRTSHVLWACSQMCRRQLHACHASLAR